MIFLDGRLEKDPELIELRKEFQKLGKYCPSYNYDEYDTYEDYIAYCHKELAKLKEGKK